MIDRPSGFRAKLEPGAPRLRPSGYAEAIGFWRAEGLAKAAGNAGLQLGTVWKLRRNFELAGAILTVPPAIGYFSCVALSLILASTPLRAATEPAIRVDPLSRVTASDAAVAPNISVDSQGTAWLTWIEKTDTQASLRYSTLAPGEADWSSPRTIASGANWHAGASDFPAFTVGERGQATALWYVTNPPSPETAHLHHGAGYHAVVSLTTDGGKTWSAPAPLARGSDMTEFASLATLADGRVLAVWLDARMKKSPGHPAPGARPPPQQLFSRILGTDAPDALVDAMVCDCCQTSLTAFPDGSALLAYRGRTDEEVRDIRVARFRRDRWEDSRPLNSDDWRIAGCPVNGPQLASDGGRVAAAWFTAADNDPRVLASLSPDAGARFLMPLRLSETKPTGRVSTVLLHNGAMLVTWVDAEGALRLRRISPDFVSAQNIVLTTAEQGKIKGFPRAALWRDYTGGTASAKILIAYTAETAPTLRTLLVEVPEGQLVAAEKNCDCDSSPEQLTGYAIRGTIGDAPAGGGRLRVQHFEIPGIFAAGTREFRVAPDLLAAANQPGRQFLARVEKRDGAWWLFDVRFLAAAPR